MKFLIHYRRQFMTLAVVLMIGTFAMMLSGCGVPTWLTDANSLIALVGSSFASVASFIAGLSGNAALAAALNKVSAWITDVETAIQDLETLIGQYNGSHDAGVLANIEAALAALKANVATDFSNLGLPSAVLNIIAGVAGLALEQLTAWGSLIPGLTAKAGESFTVVRAMTKAEYTAAVNALFVPTGDAETDAAIAKVQKLR